MSSGKVVLGTLATPDDGLYDIVLINESILEEALTFLKDHFFTSEAICKAIKVLENPPLLEDLLKCMKMMITKEAQGSFASIAVMKKLTNQIICVMCFSLRPKRDNQTYFGDYAENHCQDELMKRVFQFVDATSSKVNVYDYFNVDYMVECEILSTHEDYRRKQFGKKITEFVVKTIFLKNLPIVLPEYQEVIDNFDNYAFRSICSSKYSKQIANNVGCEDLCYADLRQLKLNECTDQNESFEIFTVGCKLSKLIMQTYSSKY